MAEEEGRVLNSLEKAAVFLRTIGEAEASEILKHMAPKEVQKVGGRLVMQVGDKEIACNGELTLFLLTRNQNAVFAPDLCSRVTFVNFTVTPSSLQSQCLNIFLKSEREEVD